MVYLLAVAEDSAARTLARVAAVSADKGELADMEELLAGAGASPLSEALARHIADRLDRDAAPSQALRQLELADVCLAWRCAQGDVEALAELDRRIDSVVPALAARDFDSDEIDEVCQAVRVRLLVPQDGEPRILQYRGRGRLGGFLRAAALRTALNLRRDDRARSVVDELQHVATASHDPELERLKNQFLGEFRQALAAAFEGLEAEKKVLLRHQLVDDLSIDQIGALYQIHRSTAARRVVAARESLVRSTRKILSDNLGLSLSELSSVLRLIETRLERAADALDAED